MSQINEELNIDEVLQIAEDIERNGKAYYAAAAAIASDNKMKTLFLELAEWEGKHQNIFKEMRLACGRDQEAAILLDSSGEEGLYLKAVADGKIFTAARGPDALLRESGGKLGVLLNFAIEREKDSVVFYTAISRVARDEKTREIVDKIVGEEISHIRFLSMMFAQIDR